MPRCDTLAFPLCRQTVTLYHADHAAQTVARTVLHGVFLDHRRRGVPSPDGGDGATAFLLVIPAAAGQPGRDYTLAPQDRVLPGEGPAVAYADWPRFIPALVPGLCVVQYVDAKTANGRPSHVEAGGHWTAGGTGAHSLTN